MSWTGPLSAAVYLPVLSKVRRRKRVMRGCAANAAVPVVGWAACSMLMLAHLPAQCVHNFGCNRLRIQCTSRCL